jgi:hypothetical protein
MDGGARLTAPPSPRPIRPLAACCAPLCRCLFCLRCADRDSARRGLRPSARPGPPWRTPRLCLRRTRSPRRRTSRRCWTRGWRRTRRRRTRPRRRPSRHAPRAPALTPPPAVYAATQRGTLHFVDLAAICVRMRRCLACARLPTLLGASAQSPRSHAPAAPQELLSFAEANEEVGLRAMMSIASAVPEGAASPGATLAAAARASGLRAPPPPQPPSTELVPEPAFVVKTRDEGGRKVFVNVCGSARVAAPGDWASGQARPYRAQLASHPLR